MEQDTPADTESTAHTIAGGSVNTLWLASTNANKLKEIQAFVADRQLPYDCRLPEGLMDVAETGTTFLENARLKLAGVPAGVMAPGDRLLAEDSGFVVPVLAGQYDYNPFPGVYSNRWMTPDIRESLLCADELGKPDQPVTHSDKNAGILKLMVDQFDRRAFYLCGLVLADHTGKILFETEERTALKVIKAPRGIGGFGYDPIVVPDEPGIGSDRTMAELSLVEKNQISHRGKALRLCTDFLLHQGIV